MVEWLAGNRVRGLSTERTTSTGFNGGFTGVGGWKELARTTLGSNNSTIDVSSIPDKRYYMILMDYTQTSDFSGLHRLGNSSIDTGNNYHNRQSNNGGTDASSQATYVRLDNGWQSGDRKLAVEYIANKSDKEKLIMNHMVRSVTTGASQAPQRSEVVSKWSNISNVIDKFQMMNGGTYASGSEVVVLGWDDADTHTTNFWEELASVELSSASDTLSSGTITAKKYLWVQTYVKATGGTVEPDSRFNGDSGSNYADRYSINGSSDSTGTSLTKGVRGLGCPYRAFFNDFIINNASNEKLVIRNVIYPPTSGSGSAPSRRETVGKWANTSNQITSIDWVDNSGGAGQMDTGSIIKVWGSD